MELELQGKAEKVTGGCFCGAVRYEAEVHLDDAYYCHCRTCQQTSGAPAEVGVLVKPESIDDLGAMRLARDIVKKIEEGLEYPGQIKVTMLREIRAVDYAK